MITKLQILNYYKQLVQDRIDVFQDMISGLTDDAQNDAKGSAGDKHETGGCLTCLTFGVYRQTG